MFDSYKYVWNLYETRFCVGPSIVADYMLGVEVLHDVQYHFEAIS